MNRRNFLKSSTCAGALSLWSAPLFAKNRTDGPKRKPNIIVILADDQGYGDVGYHGGKQIPTPHIDSIARKGVWCSAGYTAAAVCGPSRAGLMTGQYQQRFGFEDNPGGPFRQTPEVEVGTPLSRKNMAERLKTLGYATGMVGKWHDGKDAKFQPPNRGFDEFFGFNNGAASYYIGENEIQRLLRGSKPVAHEAAYLTDAFGREAVSFIERHKANPFFLYLSFNAVHGPLQAPPEAIERYAHIADKRRRTLAAMLDSMDANIGKVLDKVRELNLEEDTLIIFYSDNGGKPTDEKGHGNASLNTPLRGQKGEYYEGGIRVPFCLQWKGRLPENKRYDHPVSALDILPTAIAAAGGKIAPEWNLDGVNLLPYLTGESSGPPHQYLYWRQLYHWAIRDEEWKLVQLRGMKEPELFHISADMRETTNLAAQQPEIVKRLRTEFKRWAAQMIKPQWGWQPGICGQKFPSGELK